METNYLNKYTIGFDLGGSALKFGYGNSTEGLLYFTSIHHKEKTLNALKQLFQAAIDDIAHDLSTKNIPLSSIMALGIASPGIIDTKKGTILGSTPNIPFIKDVCITEILAEILVNNDQNIPVFIENDANLMTLAEAAARDTNSTLGITIGSGIGTGFVAGNTILSGENNRAMEAGHIIVVPDGRICKCGKKGCVEAYCSADSMKRIINEKFPETENLTIDKIISHTDSNIQKTLYEILDIFAIAIANIVMILNPETIVIGGGVVEIPSFDIEYLKHQIYAMLTPEFKDFQIEKAKYENKAGVYGAILFAENMK